jgi:hypothetical protein
MSRDCANESPRSLKEELADPEIEPLLGLFRGAEPSDGRNQDVGPRCSLGQGPLGVVELPDDLVQPASR